MIVVQAPLRISFLGGGTDFEDFSARHGGAVLTTAIDKRVYVIVKERFDDLIVLNYSQRETVHCVADIRHDLIREAMQITGIDRGIEITTLADIPSEGTGLGSSSSITVGLLLALYAYQNKCKSPDDLVKAACDIEINILGRPIGKQDQYIAAHGNLRHVHFTNGHITSEEINLSEAKKTELTSNLILFFTGITRSAGDILTEQKGNISERVEILKQIAGLAQTGKEAMLADDFDYFGELLHKGWELKKMLASKITNSLLDEMYACARRAGAIGGKIAGAGGGGFLLLYCPQSRRAEVHSALKLRELPFNMEQSGARVVLNYRE